MNCINPFTVFSVHCTDVNAFKCTINLKTFALRSSWNFNPTVIEGSDEDMIVITEIYVYICYQAVNKEHKIGFI
jgi:hypothetical protein